MRITVCDYQFDTETIKDVNITDSTVLIDAEDDYHRIRYTNESEITEIQAYLRFKELKVQELMDAVLILIITCDYFINSKTQCMMCPLKREHGCVFNSNPIDWRN